ncbi:MAG: radical SAM protein [archaeon]
MKDNKNLYSGNKLLKHLDKLSAWQKGEIFYPINVDFDLTNACNNKCPRCMFRDSLDGTRVDTDKALSLVSEFARLGVKSVIYQGGGEPTCHPDFEQILRFTKEKGLEVGVSTNGYEVSSSTLDAIVDCCEWIRISLDASNPQSYQITHGMTGDSFNKVLRNIKALVNSRNKKQSNLIIGIGYLVGPKTIDGISDAARIVKELGADYIRFRPFNYQRFDEYQVRRTKEQLTSAAALSDESFEASFRTEWLEEIEKGRPRPYCVCYVPHFTTSITSNLKMYPCCVLKDKPETSIGNLNKNSFEEVWNSEKRRNAHKSIDLTKCPNPCQFERANDILLAIQEEIKHENFL